jgi:hypothetical protein
MVNQENIPWRELRPNPRTLREQAAAPQANLDTQASDAAVSTSFLDRFDMGDLNKRLAFGGICGGVTGIAFGLSEFLTCKARSICLSPVEGFRWLTLAPAVLVLFTN